MANTPITLSYATVPCSVPIPIAWICTPATEAISATASGSGRPLFSPSDNSTIVDDPKFKKTFRTVGDDGESLKRVPPGYPADHPAADLLRLKNVTFGRRLADRDATSPKLPAVIAESFEIGTPLMRYLAAVG